MDNKLITAAGFRPVKLRVRLTQEQYDALKATAANQGESMSALAARMIREGLKERTSA